MEIEAKLAIPNRHTYRTLLRLAKPRTSQPHRPGALAGYDWRRVGTVRDVDRYFDTSDGRLLAAGYACRFRLRGGATIATLKSVGGAEGAVHQRDELEVALPVWNADPAAWPESPARTLALELAAGAELNLLCELRQSRALFDVVMEDRAVGQLSLDTVRVMAGPRPSSYYELEIELAEAGRPDDLDALVSELTQYWKLIPEPRSKFERALMLLHDKGEAEARLAPEERTQVEAYADANAAELARRAVVVLAWADGLPTREIAARSGLSAGRVRYWVRTFRAERMGVFDAAHPAAAQPVRPGALPEAGLPVRPGASEPPPTPAPTAQPLSPWARRPGRAGKGAEGAAPVGERSGRRGLPTVSRFCRQHGVDMEHARYVAAQAVTLFDALRAVHGVPRRRRRLLRQAAFLHTVGMAQDPERHHEIGRDLILAQPLHNISTTDRLALACIIAFHRSKVRPDREPAMAALESKLRPQVLAMSALLHVAEALDSSQTRSTDIVEIRGVDTPHCEVLLSGPKAEQDAVRAAGQADLWYRLFDQELAFLPPEVEEPRQEVSPPTPAPTAPPLSPWAGKGAEHLPEGAQEAVEAGAARAGQEPKSPLARPGSPVRGGGPADVEVQGSAALRLSSEEPMSEAGRQILQLHFGRMLANEPGTRLGQDIEALHDMRVATRRMRAALQIFEPHYEAKTLAPLVKGLRRTGRTLGAVRDLDVLLQKAEAFRASLPAEQVTSFEPLLVHWQTRREVARSQMLEYLDHAPYRKFTDDFGAFVTTPGEASRPGRAGFGAGAVLPPPGEPAPYQVRHVVPRLIIARYEAVRAYEPVISSAPLTTYHMLRIDCKQLRYAMEFFRDILGREAPDLIKQVTAMQDLLGEMQDAHVAEALVAEFLEQRRPGLRRAGKRKKQKSKSPEWGQPPILEGVESYLAALRAVQHDLLDRFPTPWESLTGYEFRRALALSVAVL